VAFPESRCRTPPTGCWRRSDARAALPPAPRRAPYASAVETEKYEERRDGSVAIHQQILVGRPTQRAIVLGKGGTRIKAIGEAARKELEELMGRKVHLFLHVKVKPDWEEDRGLYREIGLDWVE
jgi:GTP-binding protein Era